MRVNRPNLIVWYDDSPEGQPLPVFQPDCRTGALVTFAGETTFFYLNLIRPLDAQPALSVKLVEARAGGTLHEATGQFQLDMPQPGKYTVYGSLNCPSVRPGLYRWQLTLNATVFSSNLVEVLSPGEARACSALFTVRNPRSLQGVRYAWIEDTFFQTARYRCALIDAPYVVETSAYREATTGLTRPYNTAADKLLTFRTAPADRLLLEGIEIALLHEQITINGIPVTPRDHLSITAGKFNLHTGQFSVIDQTFANALIP